MLITRQPRLKLFMLDMCASSIGGRKSTGTFTVDMSTDGDADDQPTQRGFLKDGVQLMAGGPVSKAKKGLFTYQDMKQVRREMPDLATNILVVGAAVLNTEAEELKWKGGVFTQSFLKVASRKDGVNLVDLRNAILDDIRETRKGAHQLPNVDLDSLMPVMRNWNFLEQS